MKPVACGNQVYSTGSLRSAATSSAILFSKPSLFSFENGRLAGSAHTLSAAWLTRSARWRSCAHAGSVTLAINTSTRAMRLLPGTKTGLLSLLRGCRLFNTFGWTTARQHAVGARLEINVDVVDIAHDVGVIAQRRHLALLVGAYHFAAAGDDRHEIGIAHGLQRLDQSGRVAGAFAIRAVADMAFGVIPAKSRKGVPIDGAVAADVVGRRPIGGLPFAVLFFLVRLRGLFLLGLRHRLRDRERGQGGEQHQDKANLLHKQPHA